MKRLLTIMIMSLLACANIYAQTSAYHPFVEIGKRWCVHGFRAGGEHTVTEYYFSMEEVLFERDGHSYEQLRARTQDGEDRLVGWLREENQRVYLYDEEQGKELLTYDFSLQEGDQFELEYGDFYNCEVTRVDTVTLNGKCLKTIIFEANDRTSDAAVRTQVEWVEGIGQTSCAPLDGLLSHQQDSWSYHVAYVVGSAYLPLSFSDPSNGWWGQNLVKGWHDAEYEENREYWHESWYWQDQLHYELVPDPDHDAYALHVYGIMWIQCGDENYIYCRMEQTEEEGQYKLYLQKEEPAEATDCKHPYHVDLYFPYFRPELHYVVVNESGEHPVSFRQDTYRPFIEEGKVWKVGWFPGDMNTARKLDYYYFDGDSIYIDGRLCHEMKCRHESNEYWGNTEPLTEDVGTFYEDGRRVYCKLSGMQDFVLLYDFESNIGDTVEVYGGVAAQQYPTVSCIISQRAYENNAMYKGNVTYVAAKQPRWNNELQTNIDEYYYDNSCLWIEGIGASTPISNIVFADWDGDYRGLMSCTVNGEVLYLNPYYIDGVTPTDGDVKKQWLDFTHTVKTKPKAPALLRSTVSPSSPAPLAARQAESRAAEGLSGEYSSQSLFVNFQPLAGQYTVSIKAAEGEEVYHKEVQTSNVVGLNTDLTQLPYGSYIVAVENDDELYTATLTLPLIDTAVHGLPNEADSSKIVNCKCFDITGRRLAAPPARGLYISNGKKRIVKL